MKYIFVLVLALLSAGGISPVFADSPDCADLGNCVFNLAHPFDFINDAFNSALPSNAAGTFPLIFWGAIGVFVFLRAGLAPTGIYGVAVIAGFLTSGAVKYQVPGLANDFVYFATVGLAALGLFLMFAFGKRMRGDPGW